MAEQLITTIKSICCHNQNVCFYLFNRDFPQEWFDIIRDYLHQLDCDIVDVKIGYDELNSFKTLPHIQSPTTFFRYFIAEKVEADISLYLDCDLVVNGNLDYLFNQQLGEHYIAGCLDDFALRYFKDFAFNAGMMVINHRLWQQDNIAEQAMKLSVEKIDQLRDGDQSVLNILFKDRWLRLDQSFNYLIGGEHYYRRNNLPDLILRSETLIPYIMHYNTSNKPWLPIYDLPFRSYYWHYYKMTWQEIIQKYHNNENT